MVIDMWKLQTQNENSQSQSESNQKSYGYTKLETLQYSSGKNKLSNTGHG